MGNTGTEPKVVGDDVQQQITAIPMGKDPNNLLDIFHRFKAVWASELRDRSTTDCDSRDSRGDSSWEWNISRCCRELQYRKTIVF